MKATIYKIYPSALTNGNYRLTMTKPEADTDTIYDEQVYDLPDGYTVAQDAGSQTMIFDPNGEGCALVGDKTGEAIDLISTKLRSRIYLNYTTEKNEKAVEARIKNMVMKHADNNLAGVDIEPVTDWYDDCGCDIRDYQIIETYNQDGLETEKKYYMRVSIENDCYIQLDYLRGYSN